MLRRYKSEQIIRVALFCQAATGIILYVASANGWIGLTGTILLILSFLSCQGFIFPNSSALSMAPFHHNAGSASALMGAIQMGIGAFTAALVSYLSDHTPMPMTMVMACCALISFCILMSGRNITLYQATIQETEEETVDSAWEH